MYRQRLVGRWEKYETLAAVLLAERAKKGGGADHGMVTDITVHCDGRHIQWRADGLDYYRNRFTMLCATLAKARG